MKIRIPALRANYLPAFLILLFALCDVQTAHSQQLQPVPGYGFQWNRGRMTTLFGLPTDTFAVTGTMQSYPWLASKSNTLYQWNTSTLFWERAGSASITYPYSIKKYLNGYGSFVSLNSDSLTEGSTNLFYTNARARAAFSANLPLRYNSSTGVYSIDTSYAYDPALVTHKRMRQYFDSILAAGLVTGTGAANRVAYWNGTNTLTSSSKYQFDGTDIALNNVDIYATHSTDYLAIGDNQSSHGGSSIEVSGAANKFFIHTQGNGIGGNMTRGTYQFEHRDISLMLLGSDEVTDYTHKLHFMPDYSLAHTWVFPNGRATDTLATLYDVRAGIGGGSDGGIHSVNTNAAFGIIKVNDSTVRADTLNIPTLANRDKLKDSLLSVLVPKSRTISTNAPLTGGGDLSADRTFGIDTSRAVANSLATNAIVQHIIDSLAANGSLQGSIYAIPWYQYYVDITGSSLANGHVTTVGTGSSIQRLNTPASDNWIGSLEMNVGTTNTGFAYYHFGNTGGLGGVNINNSYRYNFGTRIRLEDLSDGTDTYHVMLGFADDNHDIGTVVDGILFRYTSGDSSGKWIAHTESNNTVTEVTTTTTVAADTDYELEITVFNGSAYFYINKALAATISTNIPTGVTRSTGMSESIRKSAGTTNRKMYIEYLAFGKRNY